jgi:hypothetical protein
MSASLPLLVSFEMMGRVDDANLIVLSNGWPCLTSLKIQCNTSLTDTGLCPMIANHPSLTTLAVSQCHITDITLTALAMHCPNLSCLDLYMCSEVTDEGVITLSQQCLYLKNINLTSCPKITPAILTPLIQNCFDTEIHTYFPPLLQGILIEHNHRRAHRARECKTVFD